MKRAVCILLVLLFCLTACGGAAESEKNVRDKLAFSIPGTVTGQLNPFYASEQGDIEILASLCGKFISTKGIAEVSKEIREDGILAVTVKIKDGIVCGDESEIYAGDLIYAIQLVCDPTYDGPYTGLANSSLVGLLEFRDGQTKMPAGVKRLNERTVEICFEDPTEDYEALLDLPVVRTDNYGGYTRGACAAVDIRVKRAKVMGTEAYQLDQWLESDGAMVNLKINEYYRGNVSKNKAKTVSFRHVNEKDVGLNMQLGQLTAGFLYDREEAKRQAEQYNYKVVMLADGALLCRQDAPFAEQLLPTDTILSAIASICENV